MTKGKVLILDDSPTTIAMVQEVLSRAGWVVVAETSPFTLNKLVRAEQPDLILIDLEMPALPGDRLVTMCQGSAWFGKIPLVYYSAAPREKLEELAMRTGAAGHISKDVDAGRLIELVELYVRTGGRRRSPGSPGSGPSHR